MGERSDRAGDTDLPWLSALDPVANARALGDIQRRGLRAAGEIIDRLVAAVDGDGDGDGAQSGDGEGEGDGERDGEGDGDPSEAATGDRAGDADDGAQRARTSDRSPGGPDLDGLVELWAELTKRSLQAISSAPKSSVKFEVDGDASTPLRFRLTIELSVEP